jgi:hypothetical protein
VQSLVAGGADGKRQSYQVSSHVGGCVSCSAAVKSLQTANQFCASIGKFVIVRNATNTTNPFGYVVANELTFSCVDKDDPEYVRPTLRKDNGVTTTESR